MFSLAVSGDDDAAPDTLELPRNMLKALRWMVRTFGLDNFPPLVGPLFASVLAFSAKDRREAPPLALDFVLYLELVLRSGTPAVERIWAGSFLVCVWSSLRFSDAQHVRWSSVNAASDASVLRGVSYRTKTGTRGTPFALGGCGLSASKGAVPWISVWLHSLQEVWDCLDVADSAVEPDCLFFRCDLAARTFEPLSYTQCLRVLRTSLTDWLGTHDSGKYSSHCLVSSDVSVDALVATYSLHSCKATVLSWLAQLDERPDVRLAQGHHSNPLLQSMTLYSRDSVLPALQAQSRLMSLLELDFDSLHASDGSGHLRTVSGWSPVAPQHRGSQQPFAEPPLLDRGCMLDVIDSACLSFPSFSAPRFRLRLWSLHPQLRPRCFLPPGHRHRLQLLLQTRFLRQLKRFLLLVRMFQWRKHLHFRSPTRFCFSALGRFLTWQWRPQNLASVFRASIGRHVVAWLLRCPSVFECRLALCRHKACRAFVDREPLV